MTRPTTRRRPGPTQAQAALWPTDDSTSALDPDQERERAIQATQRHKARTWRPDIDHSSDRSVEVIAVKGGVL